MGKYFGTDGFRGEANVVLNYDHAIKIGRFLGWYYGARIGKKAKIVIGKDTRRLHRPYGFRSGRLYHACHDDAVRVLYHENR